MKNVLLILSIVVLSSFGIKKNTFTVVVDAGHGGSDSGALKEEYLEKQITLAVSEQIEHLIKDQNINVVFTRKKDENIKLKDRVELTKNANLFISLHVSSSETNASGCEIYYQKEGETSELSEKYSYVFKKNFENSTSGVKFRKTDAANFYVLKNSNCPALLIELGFITNDEDVNIITNKKHQKEIAETIIASINEIAHI